MGRREARDGAGRGTARGAGRREACGMGRRGTRDGVRRVAWGGATIKRMSRHFLPQRGAGAERVRKAKPHQNARNSYPRSRKASISVGSASAVAARDAGRGGARDGATIKRMSRHFLPQRGAGDAGPKEFAKQNLIRTRGTRIPGRERPRSAWAAPRPWPCGCRNRGAGRPRYPSPAPRPAPSGRSRRRRCAD